ncbi:hypothetical protein HY946_01215 [Candidatus Gottesmanbacteria bacterium]|nr:hypothetical protein [Candidatus Gottesmanbacteria bacterium]
MVSFLPHFLILATTASLSLAGPRQALPISQPFKITINLSTGGRTTLGTDTVLSYDPRFLSALKIVPGKTYPNYPANLIDIDNVHGKLRFSGTVGFSPPKTAEGVFGEVFFLAKKEGQTQINLEVKPKETTDSNIVPDFGGIDLLTEKPKEITITAREASLGEKILNFIKQIYLWL